MTILKRIFSVIFAIGAFYLLNYLAYAAAAASAANAASNSGQWYILANYFLEAGACVVAAVVALAWAFGG